MPLSDKQKQIYASAPSGDIFKQALSLYHPRFSRDFHMTNYPIGFDGKANGALVQFVPVPFTAIEPSRDDRGQQDLRLSIDNIDPSVMLEIERAAGDYSTSIRAEYRIFINNLPDPSLDPPLVLWLSELEVTLDQVIGTATRTDVVNMEFPRVFYSTRTFPGLRR